MIPMGNMTSAASRSSGESSFGRSTTTTNAASSARKDARCLARIVTILDQYLPDVLVLQDTSAQGTPRARRIVKLNEAVAALAEARGLPVYVYSRDKVLEAFASFGVTNKQGLAEIIAKHIPAFERYVPP